MYTYCYICGKFIKIREIKLYLNACETLCQAYETHCKYPISNIDKSWAPQVGCSNCKDV